MPRSFSGAIWARVSSAKKDAKSKPFLIAKCENNLVCRCLEHANLASKMDFDDMLENLSDSLNNAGFVIAVKDAYDGLNTLIKVRYRSIKT